MVVAVAKPAELADFASHPYRLVQFVNSHQDFSWKPLWSALHVKDQEAFLPDCEGPNPCSGEVLAAAGGEQVIVVLAHKDSYFRVYVRYQRSDTGRWKASGTFQPFVKYFAPEYRLVQTASKSFLVTTGQGVAGTGLSTTLEFWLDLTAPTFTPTFTFTKRIHYEPWPNGVGWNGKGRVLSLQTGPPERLVVAYELEFRTFEFPNLYVPLGTRRDTVVSERTGSGPGRILPDLSTATQSEIEYFYELGESWSDTSTEQRCARFVRFNRDALAKIAAGPDTQSRRALSRIGCDASK